MAPRESWNVGGVEAEEHESGAVVRAVHLVPASASARAAVVRREGRGAPWGSGAAQALRRLDDRDLAAVMGLPALPPPGPRRNLTPPQLRPPPPAFELASPPTPAARSTPATAAAALALPAVVEAVRTGDDEALLEALRPIGRALRRAESR